MSTSAAHRLQMLLVVQWLDAGAPADGVVEVEVEALTDGLGVGDDRRGVLTVMSALGELEEAGDVAVTWLPGRARVTCTLGDSLRRSLDPDAADLS
ncbi:MAG: hypothetical protein R2878_05430 [Thermoleophilia bacterium]